MQGGRNWWDEEIWGEGEEGLGALAGQFWLHTAQPHTHILSLNQKTQTNQGLCPEFKSCRYNCAKHPGFCATYTVGAPE